MPSFRALALRLLSSAVVVVAAAPAVAAPALTSARAAIAFTAPTACEVTLTVTVGGAASVEHRLEAPQGSHVELIDVRDAIQDGDVRDIGRTRALTVTPSGASPYTIHYRFAQAADRPHRCPIWLPAAPADGRSRPVQLSVRLPEGTVASGTMPAFTWTGAEGTTTLPHLPAFVIVPYTKAGEARPWDVARVMDVVALAAIAGGSGLWLRRRQRRR